MSDLFPPDFVSALIQLRIEARQVPRGGHHAEHHAREPGSGIEFRDYRPYAPGDDVRRVDWNLYRRFGRVFLRLLDEVRDLPLYCLTDMSDSLWLEQPPRADAARRSAAVMAAVSLNQLDAAAVFPFGADLGTPLPATRGKQNLHRVLAFLEGLTALGRTDLRRSLQTFSRLPVKPGLAVVISDFFDPHGLEAVGEGLATLRHRLVMIRVMRGSDGDPELRGEFRLADCESEETLDVSVSDRLLDRYREAYVDFEGGLRTLAARRGAFLLEVDMEEALLPQFGLLFQDGVLKT